MPQELVNSYCCKNVNWIINEVINHNISYWNQFTGERLSVRLIIMQAQWALVESESEVILVCMSVCYH